MTSHDDVYLGHVERSRTTLVDPSLGTASAWRVAFALKPRPSSTWVECFQQSDRLLGLGHHEFRIVGQDVRGSYGYGGYGGYGYGPGVSGVRRALRQLLRPVRRRLQPPVLLEFSCAPTSEGLATGRQRAILVLDSANTMYRARLQKRQQVAAERNAAFQRLESAVRDVESRRRRGAAARLAAGVVALGHIVLGVIAGREV